MPGLSLSSSPAPNPYCYRAVSPGAAAPPHPPITDVANKKTLTVNQARVRVRSRLTPLLWVFTAFSVDAKAPPPPQHGCNTTHLGLLQIGYDDCRRRRTPIIGLDVAVERLQRLLRRCESIPALGIRVAGCTNREAIQCYRSRSSPTPNHLA